MNGLGQYLLSTPGFAKQQDRGVGLRNLSNLLNHAQKARRTAHKALRRPDLCDILEIGILALKAIFQNLDFRHGAQELFLLPLPRDGMREHLAHELQPCDQIVRPCAGFTESRESDGSNDPAANPKRDAKMRMKPVRRNIRPRQRLPAEDHRRRSCIENFASHEVWQ